MVKKIGIIVQRYGLEINGGAEYHARLIAEKMAKNIEVEVFTSTALDYLTWGHHYKNGKEIINGITINRFRVSRERDPEKFGKLQRKVFENEHTLDDEKEWLYEEGPYMPDLISELEKRGDEFYKYIFFSYRYYHSYEGLKKFGKKSVLVPTAEHDEVIYMRLFKDLFHMPSAIIYNSHEEKEVINKISGNRDIPGDIVGVGSEIPDKFDPASFRKKYGINSEYILYIGRLDENKGVPELLRHFIRFSDENKSDIKLVLVGKSVIDIPEHKNIEYLGFIEDNEKFDALSGAEFLVIPSQYESLSMVTLEAWAIGVPVIANGRTDVLKGQCRRSNAGLWYTNYNQFREAFNILIDNKDVRERMGENGRKFFKENYSWEVIENKYIKLLDIKQ